METKGYGNIPDTLFEAITFLAQALPKRRENSGRKITAIASVDRRMS